MKPLPAKLAGLLLGTAVLGCGPQVAGLEAEDVLFFKAGPVTLRPQLGLTETYNDNVFYLPRNEVSDFITVLSPGFKLQLGRPDHNHLLLTYGYDHLFYADNNDLNTGHHTVEFRSRLEGQRLRLEGADRIQFLSSPLGGVERVLATRNIDRSIFDDTYTLSYNISPKTAAYLRGAYHGLDYQRGINLYDLDTLTGTLGFGYRAFPKTVLFGELYYRNSATTANTPLLPENPDVNSIGGFLGARGNFTEKLMGTVKVGYESREFSDGSPAPSAPVVDLSVTQRFTEKTALTLSYSRQNNISVQYTRRSYTADIVGLQFSQIMGPSRKWQAALGGTYSRYDYEASGGLSRIDYDYLRAYAGLSYQIQLWLAAQIRYDFEDVRHDSRAVVDYTVNRATLRLAIGY